jgi:hypothetical protein
METDGNIERMEHTTTAAAATVEKSPSIPKEYRPRTIRLDTPNSRERYELLPSYPLESKSHRSTMLLLANMHDVDRDALERQSFGGSHGVCPFEFRRHRFVHPVESFMVDFFEDCFYEPSRRWNIDYSIVDYNLYRLRQCMDKYTVQTEQPAILSIADLPMALEFYLQIDGK